MNTIHDIKSLRRLIRDWKRTDEKIALVPTMGNLHEGHLSLLSHARRIAKRTVVSIFVNPIQFGRGEDYEHYPSTLDSDNEKLERAGVDLVFTPNLKELYPGGITEDTRVTVPAISEILCGESRPGHFTGVATVVIKLLNNVQPDFALFGEKDFQQVLVIRRMVQDLLIPVEIIALPIIREDDGLAMSSRNNYLTPELRQYAAVIYESLSTAAENLKLQRTTITILEAACREAVEEKGMRLEYVSVRRSEDLTPAGAGDRELIILMAVWLGKARLIDNVQVLLEEPLRGACL
ncbi:MAG: pantoate--beta-alanine ligase [Proteobacteria bacterium]|nr:pantoate--beta-alanine ligase [Pseudomonadota bacterium]